MALFEVFGVLVAAAGAGLLIDAYKCGVFGFGPTEFNGFMLAAILFGTVTLVGFTITAFGVTEKDYSEKKKIELKFFQGAKEVMRNVAFKPYLALVTFFRVGIDMVVVVIPYVVTTVMGGEEGDAVGIQLVVMVGAVLLFPLVIKLSNAYGKRAVTIWGAAGFVVILPLILTLGKIPGLSPMLQGYIIFGLATFPVAVFNVLPRPLLADVIDYDEQQSGLRREAIYNGMEGLFSRSGSGFAWMLSSLLFSFFGNSAENPMGIMLTGPAGALLVLAGLLFFLKYPFKE